MDLAKQKWPCLDARWKSSWKALYKSRLQWFDRYFPLEKQELEHFAATGKSAQQTKGVDMSQYKEWEWSMSLTLANYASLRAFEFESKAQREQSFDVSAAAGAYSAARVAQMIDLNTHIRSVERLGMQLSSMDITLLPLTALGVVIGDRSALPLARLLIAASRRGWYERDERYPIYVFMLLLMADFLGEPVLPGTAALLGDTPLAPLLAAWRDPRSDNIVPLVLAACDFHTSRGDLRKDMEFSEGAWWYTPIEIMLLMRLRNLRHLENAEFEHPLWTNAFTGIHAGMPTAADELIQRVERRMHADGYDEEFIVQGAVG
jgi:hypothetical protein